MPLEYPDQTYHPSAKIILSIRFDEFGDAAVRKKAPAKPVKNLKGLGGDRDKLLVTKDATAPEGVTRFLVVPKGPAIVPSGPGARQTQSDDDYTQDVGGVVPKTAQLKMNGMRSADQLTVSIKWDDMPIDSRTVRSAAILYYLGTVTATEYARGVRGESRLDSSGRGEPLNLVPSVYLDPNGVQRSNLRFEGWVDKWEVVWNDGEPLIKLECRDNTQLLITQPMPAGASMSKEKPIDEAVADFLANFPQFAGLGVVYRPTTVRDAKTPPRLKDVLGVTAFTPNAGPPVSKAGAGTEPCSVWDYLTDICGKIGHIIRVDGHEIIIQRPRNLLDGQSAPRADDPYRARKLASGLYTRRTFVYGRNVQELTISRDFARLAPTNVEFRCYLPDRKRELVARFPEKGDTVAHPLPGDGKTEQKWSVVYVQGISDVATLKQAAEDYYNNIGRQEITIPIKTKNLASFGGGNEDPDLLDARPGDDVEIKIHREDGSSTQGTTEGNLTEIEKCQTLFEKLGFSKAFAARYAKTYANAAFQRIYRIKEMQIDWDSEAEGVSIEMACINYVEARVDKPSTDPQGGPR